MIIIITIIGIYDNLFFSDERFYLKLAPTAEQFNRFFVVLWLRCSPAMHGIMFYQVS